MQANIASGAVAFPCPDEEQNGWVKVQLSAQEVFKAILINALYRAGQLSDRTSWTEWQVRYLGKITWYTITDATAFNTMMHAFEFPGMKISFEVKCSEVS